MKAQLNFEFRDFASFVMGVFEEIFESNCFNDLELMGDDNIPLKAHKAILGSFSSTLREHMSSQQTLQKVKVSGVSYQDLQSLLHFVYLGEVNVVQENLEKLLALAKFLGIEQLQDQGPTIAKNNFAFKISFEFIGDKDSKEFNFKEKDHNLGGELSSEILGDGKGDDTKRTLDKVEKKGNENTEDYVVGEPSPDFDIFESVHLSHNYYRILKYQEGKKRITTDKEGNHCTRQEKDKIMICLICLKGPKKKKTLLKVGGGTTSGVNRHLIDLHPEYSDQFLKQKEEVLRLRNEKKMRKNRPPAMVEKKREKRPRKNIKVDYEWFSQSPGEIVNIKAKILLTQGYYERVIVRKGDQSYKGARCLNCSDGNPHSNLGIIKFIHGDFMNQDLRKHLRNKHEQEYERFLKQESHIIDQKFNANTAIDSEMQNEYLADIEDVEVGEAEPGYDVKEPVFFSHNFFRRIPVKHNGVPEDYAACLICVKLGGKALLKIGHLKKSLRDHLRNKHPEQLKKYIYVLSLVKEMGKNKYSDVIIPECL